MRRSMRSMWGDLPPEVLEIVLAFLPSHVLCRFRLVCKGWNHLISRPEFASLRALAPRQASSVFISPKLTDFRDLKAFGEFAVLISLKRIDLKDLKQLAARTEWEVLDTVEKRSYTLLDTFILDYLFQLDAHNSMRKVLCRHSKYTLAADGGLVYAVYARIDFQVHIVCNPVSKKFHRIADHELDCSYDHDIVVMSVDNIATMTYKIVTMESYDIIRRPEREKVYLYDSTTSVWRKLCEVPGDAYRAYSSIFMNGVLYTLFVDLAEVPWCPKLYSCDLATGAWSYTDVDLPPPSHPQDKSQLVVSWGRLFLVAYTGLPKDPSDPFSTWESLLQLESVKRKQQVNVSIWEILVAKKEVVKVAEMAKYSKYTRTMLQRPEEVMGEAVVAAGCGDSIVISCMMGRRVAFDLWRKCWRELPAYSPEYRKFGIHHQGFCAGLVDF